MWIGQEPLQSGPERSKRLQENPKRAARVTRSLSVGMIVPHTVGPLWESEVQPELRSCRETFGEHCNLLLTSCVYDCPAYCAVHISKSRQEPPRATQTWSAEFSPSCLSPQDVVYSWLFQK